MTPRSFDCGLWCRQLFPGLYSSILSDYACRSISTRSPASVAAPLNRLPLHFRRRGSHSRSPHVQRRKTAFTIPSLDGAFDEEDSDDDDDIQVLEVKREPSDEPRHVTAVTPPPSLPWPLSRPPAPVSPPLQAGLAVVLKRDPHGQRQAGERSQMAPSGTWL